MAVSAGDLKLDQLVACYLQIPPESEYVIFNGSSIKISEIVVNIKKIIGQLPELIV